MKRSDIRILIVDDDASQGKALHEALKRVGYEVRLSSNPEDALNTARQTDYKLAIIDCLLPKTNGVELALKLKASLGEDLRIILVSGIYKDKTFAKESIQKTKAHTFLTKPFDMDKFLAEVEAALGEQLDTDIPPLLDTLTMREVGSNERLKAIENGAALHGFDLPLVYSLIFGANLSGQLNISTSDGDVSQLTFLNGKLTQVQLKDSTSYFGVLLVEMGFTTPEEVEESLAQDSQFPIGERLVAAQSISPHAIRVVREEQMLIRLSKTVQDTFVDASFTVQEVANSDVVLDRERFTLLLWDWICSKVSGDWLKSHYGRWLEHPVVMLEAGIIQRRLAMLPGIQTLVDPIVRRLGEGRPIGELIDNGSVAEDQLFPILHLLTLEKLAYFGSRRASNEDSARRIKRLRKILAESVNHNHFQILGVSPKSVEREITRNYMDMAKNFHPDRVEPQAPPELRKLTEQYFTRITQAYEVLKDSETRQAYAREVTEGSAEKILQNESLFEQGQSYLRKGKYQLALDIFVKLAAGKQHRSDLFIYLCWAKMKVGSSDKKIENFLTSISEMMSKIPPEDRHSSPYFYVKGLFGLQVGDLERAKTNMKHALMMDANFVEARRDLAVVRNRLQSQEDSLGDFSTVVTKLFGRRKKRA